VRKLLHVVVVSALTSAVSLAAPKTLRHSTADVILEPWGATYFLSEEFLNSKPLNELPLDSSDHQILESRARFAAMKPEQLDGLSPEDLCGVFSKRGDGPAQEMRLEPFLQKQSMLLVVRLEQPTTGWSSAYQRVMTRYTATVEEVIKAAPGASKGDAITVFFVGGRLRLSGNTLCDQGPASDLLQPAARLLISGHGYPVVVNSWVFGLDGDDIDGTRYSFLDPVAGTALARLRALVLTAAQ
jgi:hypothetical protein